MRTESPTGRLVYRERLGPGGAYFSSPIAGDGKVYAASGRGVVTVFAAGDTLQVLEPAPRHFRMLGGEVQRRRGPGRRDQPLAPVQHHADQDQAEEELRPLHQVHEVRADIGQRLPLLMHIEEPGGAQVGNAGDEFEDVVNAFHIHRGFLRGAAM